MFENAQDFKIKDSSFTDESGGIDIITIDPEDKLDQFLQTACLSAILNGGGRADEVRCYLGTREEVIGKIERWRDGQRKADHRMLWLSGHAGAGKSAIAQTVAERGRERGVHAANFFFFRSDYTRNHARSLVATLIYQLVNFFPALRNHLTAILTSQPLSHQASVGEQFLQLLASSFQSVRHSSSIDKQITLVIDGLDECDDESAQLQILAALHTLVTRDGSPFCVFVASRAEPHLVMFFNKIASSVESLFLSDEYWPQDDIRKFVASKFAEIKRAHHFARSLSENWPAQADIDKITDKSSGQFIFAATVMRFIEYSRDSPSLSLLTVHQLRPPTNHSPFAQVDALYSHVFAKARNMRVIKWALGFNSMRAPNTNYHMLHIAGYETIDLESLFADISAIARIYIVADNPRAGVHVEFYHASLPDYLKDESRSGVYHLDNGKIATDAATACLHTFCDPDSFKIISYVLQAFVKRPSSQLSTSLLDASKRKMGQIERLSSWDNFIGTITRLYFTTNKDMCKNILQSWIRFAYMHKFDPAISEIAVDKASYRYYQRLQITGKARFILTHGFNR